MAEDSNLQIRPKRETASYYQEYMPFERLVQDIARMKDAGMRVVRVGESTWSLWEAEDGAFEYAWMDRVVDAMHQVGIKVIMGTPTYSISPSMHRKHPEGSDSRCPIPYQRNACPLCQQL